MSLLPWQADVIEDLQPFADLGTAPMATPFGTHLDVTIQRNDLEIRLEVRKTDAGIVVQPEGMSEVPFPSLLASQQFGDLQRLAKQMVILSSLRRAQTRQDVRGRTVYTHDWYVDPLVAVDRIGWSVENNRADEALKAIIAENAGEPSTTEATDLIFLTAQAGQGKSSTLRRFHLNQSSRYEKRNVKRLTFYVDAQGRGMTNLADVLAREINELRLSLPHSAILSLVRQGLVTLIVDGFDELVGARGTYEGAFASLSTFLELLQGKGQVIAAARSAFFTEEYLARPAVLSGDSGSHRITRLELVPWTPVDRSAFLDRAKTQSPNGLITNAVERDFKQIQSAPHGELLTRPLFSRDVLIATIEGGRRIVASSDLSLVSTIAQNYISREVSEKLLAPGRLPILSDAQLTVFFQDLAVEMWTLETRELDLATTRTLLELRMDEWGIEPTGARIALDRVGTFPFLMSGTEGQRRVLFEHELFFSFFLSFTLTDQIFGLEPGAQAAMARARLAHDDATLIAERFFQTGRSVQRGLDILAKMSQSRHPRQGQILVNCSSIAAALLRFGSREGVMRGLEVRGYAFDGDSFRGVALESARFVDCKFNRVDLRNARLNGDANGTDFYAAVVDSESTRIDLTGLDQELPIVQIEHVVDGRIMPVYEQDERERLLAATGFLSREVTPRLRPVDDEVLFVVTQLCRAFDEMNPVGERHSKYQSLFASPSWQRVRDALIRNELVRVTTKQTSGPRQVFYRKKFDTSQLLSALRTHADDPIIERFWIEVAGELA